MANALYTKGRQKFLEGSIAWLTDNIKVVLVDTGSYTINLSTDEFLSDIASGARVATSGNLASKSSTGGTADAADVTFTAVSGNQCSLIVVYKDTGTAGTSPLILAIDTATNLPVTPNGGDITVQWDNGTNKIFTLFQGLAERDRGLAQRLKDWLRGLKIPAELSPGGLWIPTPKVVLA